MSPVLGYDVSAHLPDEFMVSGYKFNTASVHFVNYSPC